MTILLVEGYIFILSLPFYIFSVEETALTLEQVSLGRKDFGSLPPFQNTNTPPAQLFSFNSPVILQDYTNW